MARKSLHNRDISIIVGSDGENWQVPFVDTDGNIQSRNMVVNPDTLEWENQQSGGSGAPSGEVAVTNWPADQAVSGPLTDTELRATDVKVSLDGESVSVTGAFYPATQPVSASALPLPDGAATATNQQGFIERSALNSLKRISTDASGRLRVAAESVASHAVTLTTLTNLTNWGLSTATAKSQWESHAQYQAGYRRNLVHS